MLPGPVAWMNMEVIVSENGDALAASAAEFIAAFVGERERASIGLAGGSTPKETYRLLRDLDVDWSGITFWLSDERWVPDDHADSNGHMAARALLDHVDTTFLRPRYSEYLTPADSAAFYDADLRRAMPDRKSDLILLGMGTDGHTASLFPGTAALDEFDRWFVANEVPQLDTWRLTATAPMIWRADTVVVLTAGESKASVLAEVLEGPDGVYPIQLLRRAQGRVIWMVDVAAAALLGRSS